MPGWLIGLAVMAGIHLAGALPGALILRYIHTK